MIRLLTGDCREVLKTLEDESVDAVITDPPYGIGYASAWRTRLGGGPRVNEASFGKDEFDPRWIPEAYRVMAQDSYLYCFTRWDVAHEWRAAFESAGFVMAQRLVWDKCHWKMGDLRHYGSQVEDILLMRKGNPAMFPGGHGRRGNLFRYSSAFLPEGQVDHPTQKPVLLMAEFIEDSTAPGQLVLDPFMGSGSTGVACVKMGRNFVGIDINPSYVEMARKRIETEQQQPLLFQLYPTTTETLNSEMQRLRVTADAGMFAEVTQ